MNDGPIGISLTAMGLLYALLLVPLGLLWWLRLRRFTLDVVTSVLRMTIQLALVGLYLEVLFELSSALLTFLWLAVMMVVANFSVLRKAGLRRRTFFWPVLGGLAVGTLAVLLVFLLILVRPEPWHAARYAIPLSGMLLGNCLRGNILVLERFLGGIRRDRDAFLNYLSMGATQQEAARPFLREAVQAAFAPTVATMATMGIVSLPGMLTGQVLGGADPLGGTTTMADD